METKNKTKIIIIIILILLLILLGIFLIKKHNKTNDNKKIDQENKIALENDNRIYPLEIEFYKERYSGCFKTKDNTCANVYANHYPNGQYKEEFIYSISVWDDLKKEDYQGSYTCQTNTCYAYTFDSIKNQAVIYDNELIIYNLTNKEIIKTGLKYTSTDNKKIEDIIYDDMYVSILSETSKEGIILSINNKSTKKLSSYSINNKKYLLEGYNALDKVYESNDKPLYMANKDDKSYLIEYDKVKYEFSNNASCSREDSLDYLICQTDNNKSIILNQDNYTKVKEINNITSFKVTDEYLVMSSIYSSIYKEQYIEIYNKKDLSLIKKINNVNEIEELKIDNQTFYIGSVDLGRGGEYYSTMIFDKDYNIIIDISSLPDKTTGIDKDLFRVEEKEGNFLIITREKEYLFDLKGNLKE